MGAAVEKGQGCPSHPSKSILGICGSKTLPSFVPAHLRGWRALSGSRAPPREGRAVGLPPGKWSQADPSTDYREGKGSPTAGDSLVTPESSRSALQEGGYQAQGDVSLHVCLVVASSH